MSDNSVGRLALVGLLALVVVDLVLVALAFRPDAAGASAQPPAAVSTPSTSAPTTTTAPAAGATPVSQVIAAVDGRRAWRGTLGTCRDGGASLTVTADGGRTWTPRAAPVQALGRVQPVDADRGFVIGAKGAGCSVGEYATDDDATTWRGPRAVEGGWSRLPGGDPKVVITPRRPDARPCGTTTVVDLARVSATRAVVLCADGRLVRSGDGGGSWTRMATVEGALAVGARVDGSAPAVYVARATDDCAGVEVAKLSGGAASKVACVKTSLGGAEGTVSISVVDEGGWLAVADATWRSDASLETWRAVA
ncbi:hypothetical protein [Terracoccus sp. 273MFTsu3.1]|uniref:hypothetical protein n=1 Tax=Terracoccus sp. 273MFTsu3.1 TaxID=1172188 RepID=UPI0012DC2763|nr:hypothetical protein [Terracoccus sp. 273MFTsu3.1]